MKTNKMMRLVIVVVMLVLVSTCAISGTFAKYTTSDEASDTARVAQWGVTVKAWEAEAGKDTLFADDYDGTVTAGTTGDLLVAPGTKNDTGVSFSITGAPEVDVQVTFVMEVNKDVKLAAGTYDDATTGEVGDQYTLAADYTPVVFTLTNNGNTVASGTLADIEAYLEGTTVSAKQEANTDLGTVYGTYTLTWAWVFADNDQADTTLGNAAVAAISGAETNINFSISITVTQID